MTSFVSCSLFFTLLPPFDCSSLVYLKLITLYTIDFNSIICRFIFAPLLFFIILLLDLRQQVYVLNSPFCLVHFRTAGLFTFHYLPNGNSLFILSFISLLTRIYLTGFSVISSWIFEIDLILMYSIEQIGIPSG